MAEFTHIDLRAARESRKTPRWKLAKEVGVSEDTLERWETGKQLPDPDDVGNIAHALGYPGLWHKWMLSTYDSYRERYIDAPNLDHPAARITRVRYEMSDVMALIDKVERDYLDKKIDDPELFNKFKTEARELIAALQQAIE